MCACNPIVKTPFCGKPGCQWPTQTQRLTGTVKRILVEKGFGFLEAPDGIEYFFHRSAAREFHTLQPDDLVSFEPNPNSPKGPRAEAVRLELAGVDAAPP